MLTADDIAQAFTDAHVSFGQSPQAFWTPALTLWTFLSQVLSGIKSCRAAVVRAVVAVALGRMPEELDTGNSCRARAKLPTTVLQRLTLQLGHALEEEASASWLWHDKHVVLVDGFTATLPDTAENQKGYPQPNTQKQGLGFPLPRAVVLLSLATAAERVRLGQELLRVLGKEKVGDRPDRCEPRAVKRRPKKQKLLTKPRIQAQAELLAGRGKGGQDEGATRA